MKINEIRVGNLVQADYEGTLEIVNINSEGFGFADVRKPPFKTIGRHEVDYLEPIPLTEEWLIKFGFEKRGRRYSKGWFYLWDDDSNIVFALAEMKEETGLYLVVKYVNQLQNLFYSLTNEELTITQ